VRLLSAAFRNHMQWSEFIGGDVVISPPYKWQVRFNASDIPVTARMDKPVDAGLVDELLQKFPEFRKAYADDGLSPATLRQFLEATHALAMRVRDLTLPDPDGAAL
jgi:transaldolase